MKSILIPTNLSEKSIGVLNYVKRLFPSSRVHFFLIHIIRENSLTTKTRGKEERKKESKQVASTYLDPSFIAEDKNVSLVIRKGKAYMEIIKFAQVEGMDLIVIAQNGDGNFSSPRNITRKLIERSPVPVLTINRNATEKLFSIPTTQIKEK